MEHIPFKAINPLSLPFPSSSIWENITAGIKSKRAHIPAHLNNPKKPTDKTASFAPFQSTQLVLLLCPRKITIHHTVPLLITVRSILCLLPLLLRLGRSTGGGHRSLIFHMHTAKLGRFSYIYHPVQCHHRHRHRHHRSFLSQRANVRVAGHVKAESLPLPASSQSRLVRLTSGSILMVCLKRSGNPTEGFSTFLQPTNTGLRRNGA